MPWPQTAVGSAQSPGPWDHEEAEQLHDASPRNREEGLPLQPRQMGVPISVGQGHSSEGAWAGPLGVLPRGLGSLVRGEVPTWILALSLAHTGDLGSCLKRGASNGRAPGRPALRLK